MPASSSVAPRISREKTKAKVTRDRPSDGVVLQDLPQGSIIALGLRTQACRTVKLGLQAMQARLNKMRHLTATCCAFAAARRKSTRAAGPHSFQAAHFPPKVPCLLHKNLCLRRDSLIEACCARTVPVQNAVFCYLTPSSLPVLSVKAIAGQQHSPASQTAQINPPTTMSTKVSGAVQISVPSGVCRMHAGRGSYILCKFLSCLPCT